MNVANLEFVLDNFLLLLAQLLRAFISFFMGQVGLGI